MVPMERGQKVIYADDIVLGANTAEELQQAVGMWYNQLATHGMRMSKVKTEVLVVSRGKTVCTECHGYRLWWMDSN